MSNTLTYQGHTYNDNEIVSGTSAKTQSLNMRELSVDSASFTLRPILHLGFFTSEPLPFFTRDKKRFQTSEANPLAGGVVQNAPIKQYIDGSQVAVWLAKSIDRIDRDRYRLSCVSPLGLLMQKTHYGGIYNGSKTVSDVVSELMGDAAYFISPEFENIALYGWLPIAPARDNLMQVLFAVNAALTTDADGTLRIENLSTTPSAVVWAGDIYASGATVEYQAPVTQVVLLEHNFVVGAETRKLFDGVTSDRQLIPFGQPATNLQATGFTILDSDANYAIVSAGSGVLTGTPYIDTTREIVRSVAEEDVPNEVRIEKATLVGITASSDVADRLQEYYRHRSLIKVAVADKLPRGSIQIYDPYDGNVVDACVEASELAISAVEKTSISALVGFSPWQTILFQDIRDLLTGSGTWTAPEGVTEVTAILIGGGKNGENGADGTGSTAGWSNSDSKNASKTLPQSSTESGSISASVSGITKTGGSAGTGGAGGIGGAGGKILRVNFSVTPGTEFSFSCGAANSDENGDSVFGTYSTESGSNDPAGYYDPVVQMFYGKNGVSGTSGGNGGSPNNSGSGVGSAAGGTGITGGTVSGTKKTDNMSTPAGVFNYSANFGGAGGGGAGGSSGTTTGSQGSDATVPSTSINPKVTYRDGSNFTWDISGTMYAYVLNGGNGGNGANGANALNYGCGGDGGGGGGGAGAIGSLSGSGTTTNNYHGRSGYTQTFSAMTHISCGGISSCAGGSGGAGGDGAPGCIILYYRKPVPESGT